MLNLGLLSGGTDFSMLGIKINDAELSLDKLKVKVIASDNSGKTLINKYKTENGNDFSITVKKRKVVYLENDWLQASSGRTPLITNFIFGETSLKDIRKAFGTNGFTYTERYFIKTETHLIMFNCFDLDSHNNEVLVVITKISLKTKVTDENVAEKLKLDAIILSDSKYLDDLWGKKKLYDTNYKKIKL